MVSFCLSYISLFPTHIASSCYLQRCSSQQILMNGRGKKKMRQPPFHQCIPGNLLQGAGLRRAIAGLSKKDSIFCGFLFLFGVSSQQPCQLKEICFSCCLFACTVSSLLALLLAASFSLLYSFRHRRLIFCGYRNAVQAAYQGDAYTADCRFKNHGLFGKKEKL